MNQTITLDALRDPRAWTVLALVVTTFVVSYTAPNTAYIWSDPLGILLSSQALLRQGTLKLDAYGSQAALPFGMRSLFYTRDGHLYQYQPLGATVFALPFVLGANLLGKDMANPDHQTRLQKLLAALLTAGACLGLYALCRAYVDHLPSLALAAASVFGTGVMSTMGVALWNIDFAVVFTLLGLLLLVYDDTGRLRLRPVLLGVLLFSAMLARPTTAAPAALMVGYVVLRHRALTWRVLAPMILLAVPLVAFSLHEFGAVLPDYYLLEGTRPVAGPMAGLAGSLLSPSRGLLVYSPFIVVVLVGGAWLFRRLYQTPLFVLSLAWCALQVLSVSVRAQWWGGHGYGARLLTETIPPLALLAALEWRAAGQALRPAARRVAAATFLALALPAVYINSVQGVANPYTAAWNADPNIEKYPELLFDWQYPQFLATRESFEQRRLEHAGRTLPPYSLGQPILPDSPTVRYLTGFSAPEAFPDGSAYRWTDGPSARLLFRLAAAPPASGQAALEVRAGAFGPQTVAVRLNGTPIGTVERSQIEASDSRLVLDAATLKAGLNILDLAIPDAKAYAGDPRLLGLRLVRVAVRLAD